VSARICKNILASGCLVICTLRRGCRSAKRIICRRCCAIRRAWKARRRATCTLRLRREAGGTRSGGGSGALGFWVNKSYSTGRVRLSASADKRSDIDFRMLPDPRDMARLKAGFRMGVREMLAAKQAGVVLDIFPSGFSPRIRDLTRPTRRNAVMTAIAAPLMDRSTGIRQRIMTHAIDTQHPTEVLAEVDTLPEAHLRRRVGGTWHPCGSCRMGGPADRDASARVIGVEGLHVYDASVKPTVPCTNLNIPVLMTAEKIAATICAGG
jgi:5-(hydroxymethyl)furfural/furfural oxidase